MDDEAYDQEQLENLQRLQQRPSRLNAKPIRSVVRRLMSQKGYGQTAADDQLQQTWNGIVGEEIASFTRTGKIARGILRIHTTNPVAAQEMQFAKKRILRQLQEQLPEMNIKDLRIVQA